MVACMEDLQTPCLFLACSYQLATCELIEKTWSNSLAIVRFMICRILHLSRQQQRCTQTNCSHHVHDVHSTQTNR